MRTKFAEHKRTEKDRVEKEARRLSAVYIRDHLEMASASSSGDVMAAPDSPPAIPPLALRGRAPLPPSKAAGAWQAVLDGWHSLISPRARTQTGHSIKQVERRTSEQLTSLDEEGAQGDSASAPVPANPGAMSRARGIVKQASRTVCAATGKLSKVSAVSSSTPSLNEGVSSSTPSLNEGIPVCPSEYDPYHRRGSRPRRWNLRHCSQTNHKGSPRKRVARRKCSPRTWRCRRA